VLHATTFQRDERRTDRSFSIRARALFPLKAFRRLSSKRCHFLSILRFAKNRQ
jgi:hypothetical protein